MSINNKPPFKADIVGSFLRPKYLKDARENFNNGKIDKDALRRIEDKAITDLVKKQEECGLKAVTDGEFRRSWWHLDFFWGINGISKSETEIARVFGNDKVRNDTAVLTGKISGENHPFVKDFKFINKIKSNNTVAKQTFPAPAQFLANFYKLPDYTNIISNFYDDELEFLNAIGNAYRTIIEDLYNAGCRYIQMDDTNWAYLADSNNWINVNGDKQKYFEEFASKCVYVNNLALEDKKDDLVVGTHICKGNFKSNYLYTGDYSSISNYLFERENVDAYFLEFDDERSGSFEYLKEISGDKVAVLGLITSKKPELENKDEVIARIREASKYIPLERICISPQCGFSSTEEGNILTEEDQWNKIKLVVDIANDIWK